MKKLNKKEKQAQVEILQHILDNLCIMDLNNTGRAFIKKTQLKLRGEIANIKIF